MKWIKGVKSVKTTLGLVFLIFVTACSLGRFSAPRVENYPEPTLRVKVDGFGDLSCLEQGKPCPIESGLADVYCDSLWKPGDLLGGLQPNYSMKVCTSYQVPPTGSEFIYQSGCLRKETVRYVILKENEFQLLSSIRDLKKVYAPIESQTEALSYALAATGLGVRFGLEAQEGFRYFVDVLQDTYVMPIDEGYRVLLYDYQLCGCGPHTTYTVVVLVRRDGQVEEISRKPAYEDPAEDDLCVD